MKRIISFVLLLITFMLIFTLPAYPAPPHHEHTLPLRSILCYIAVVLGCGVTAHLMIREKNRAKENSLAITEPVNMI